MSTEQSPAGELGLDGAASAIAALMDGGSPQPDPRKQQQAPAEVEETEATDVDVNDADLSDDEAPSTQWDGSDDENATEASAEGDDTGDDPLDPETLVTVKIDGKTEKVPLKEALSGYQRQADYVRKTQALAEQRRAVEAERAAAIEERTYYAQALPQLQAAMQQFAAQEPDWERLHREDPINFPLVEKQWRDYKERMQLVQAEAARVTAMQEQERQATLKRVVEGGRMYLADKMPEWKDDAAWSAAQSKLRSYGRQLGYTEEELSQAYDPRALIALEKARRYDALMANRPKPQQAAAPKPLRAGSTASSPRRETEFVRAQQRLKSSGRVEDAAAAIGLLDRRK